MPVINMLGVNMTTGAHFDGGDGAGDDGKMEARLSEFEKAVVRIGTTLEFIRQHMATNGQIKSVVSTTIVLAIGAVTVTTFVLNDAVRKAPAATQPTIILLSGAAPGATHGSPQVPVVPAPAPAASK